MFTENNVMQKHRNAGDDMHLNERPSLQYSFFLQGKLIKLYLMFIYSNFENTFVYNI